MNVHVCFVFIVLPMVIAVLSCRLEQVEPRKASPPSQSAAPRFRTMDTSNLRTQSAVIPTPAVDTLFALILPLQNSVYRNTDDSTLRAELLRASFDSSSGSFFVVGKGVVNPARHDKSGRQGQIRASEADAKRWALYLRAWHSGDRRPFGERIKGEVTYSRTVLMRTEGDTLYQLLQIPLGNVTVR